MYYKQTDSKSDRPTDSHTYKMINKPPDRQTVILKRGKTRQKKTHIDTNIIHYRPYVSSI